MSNKKTKSTARNETFQNKIKTLKQIQESNLNNEFYQELLELRESGLIQNPTFNLDCGLRTTHVQLSNYSFIK